LGLEATELVSTKPEPIKVQKLRPDAELEALEVQDVQTRTTSEIYMKQELEPLVFKETVQETSPLKELAEFQSKIFYLTIFMSFYVEKLVSSS